jgi:hypothetical protein
MPARTTLPIELIVRGSTGQAPPGRPLAGA